MRDRRATEIIRVLAERQHGVIAARQLIARGVGADVVRGRREAGLLVPVHRGVFAFGHRRLDRNGRWMAAVLACGPRAVLSHGSAAQLWHLRGSRGPVEVLRASGGGSHSGVRVHQTGRLLAHEVALEHRIPVTSIERTALDMAARLDDAQIERMLVQADKTGRLSWPLLSRVVAAGRGRKGAGRLRRIALEVDPEALETRSVPEVDFIAICRGARLPSPVTNIWIAGHLVDFVWPRQRVAVEIDSWRHHGNRPAFEGDHETDIDLIAAGYEVHRTTARILARDPGRFLANLRRALAERSRALTERGGSSSGAGGPGT